jgi:hypothetical protein
LPLKKKKHNLCHLLHICLVLKVDESHWKEQVRSINSVRNSIKMIQYKSHRRRCKHGKILFYDANDKSKENHGGDGGGPFICELNILP